MIHATLPKIPARIAARRHVGAPIAAPRTMARPACTESYAAPLTLAAVVVGALVLAVSMAIITALGA